MVHEVADKGFGSAAEEYESGRPGYPPEVVEWLVEVLSLATGRRVVDLAAGTGKLTRLLAPIGADLVAVEPVAAMRQMLTRMCPGVAVVSGAAEALPFADGSLDAVTVAQAFHWFDAGRALSELARALRPGAAFAMIWNARDRSEGWVDAVWSVMDRVERRAPWRDHEHWRDSLVEHAAFEPPETVEHHHQQELTRQQLVTRFASVSHIAVLAPEARRAVLAEIDEIVATHPDTAGRQLLALPYRVDCVAMRRRGV